MTYQKWDNILYLEMMICKCTVGAFLVTDYRVFNGPLRRSLHLFARPAHSAHSFCSAWLSYVTLACFVYPLVRQWKFRNICIHTENALNGSNRVFRRHWKHAAGKKTCILMPLTSPVNVKIGEKWFCLQLHGVLERKRASELEEQEIELWRAARVRIESD